MDILSIFRNPLNNRDYIILSFQNGAQPVALAKKSGNHRRWQTCSNSRWFLFLLSPNYLVAFVGCRHWVQLPCPVEHEQGKLVVKRLYETKFLDIHSTFQFRTSIRLILSSTVKRNTPSKNWTCRLVWRFGLLYEVDIVRIRIISDRIHVQPRSRTGKLNLGFHDKLNMHSVEMILNNKPIRICTNTIFGFRHNSPDWWLYKSRDLHFLALPVHILREKKINLCGIPSSQPKSTHCW